MVIIGVLFMLILFVLIDGFELGLIDYWDVITIWGRKIPWGWVWGWGVIGFCSINIFFSGVSTRIVGYLLSSLELEFGLDFYPDFDRDDFRGIGGLDNLEKSLVDFAY